MSYVRTGDEASDGDDERGRFVPKVTKVTLARRFALGWRGAWAGGRGRCWTGQRATARSRPWSMDDRIEGCRKVPGSVGRALGTIRDTHPPGGSFTRRKSAQYETAPVPRRRPGSSLAEVRNRMRTLSQLDPGLRRGTAILRYAGGTAMSGYGYARRTTILPATDADGHDRRRSVPFTRRAPSSQHHHRPAPAAQAASAGRPGYWLF